MIILHLKQHVGYCHDHRNRNQVYPMCCHCIWNQIDESEAHRQLQAHIQQRDLHMPNLQLIAHQLIRMLSMRLAQIFVQHNPMAYRQHTIHTIYHQQHQVRQIPRLHNQFTDSKQHDECDSYGTNISSKALRLPLRSEVEYAEYQYTYDSHYQI